MKSGIKKTFTGVAIVIILASLFVITYQLSTFDEDEKLFQRIYEEQLDVLLFSVNQYAEDVVSNWRLDFRTLFESLRPGENKRHPIRQKEPVNYTFAKELNEPLKFGAVNVKYSNELEKYIEYTLIKHRPVITKLFEYYEQGYKKIEPINDTWSFSIIVINPMGSEIKENNVLLLMVEIIGNKNNIVGISIDPAKFIELVLLSRISGLSQDKFDVGIEFPNDAERYQENLEIQNSDFVKKDLWILPGYKIYLRLKEESIATLVSKQLRINIILLASLTTMIILASVYLFVVFRKEMKLAQLKSDFISNVSHELRTPLSLISMYSETLELDRLKNEQKKREYYKIISSEAGRLGKIVNNILNFSKMEAGKRKYNLQRTDVSELMLNLLKNYSFHLEKSGFELSISNNLNNVFIYCDREAIEEAVINLLDNAVKYSLETKIIDVSLKFNDSKVFVGIKDYGIGIPSSEINKIFEKFHRVSTGLRHNTKGTGIGLSIVKHIVTAHNGFVTAVSKLNEGSEFTIELPINVGNSDV